MSSRAASNEPFSSACIAADAVGADGDLVAEPGQLHLHQVAQVGLVVGEQDAKAALMGLLHDWSSSMRLARIVYLVRRRSSHRLVT